MLLHLPGDMSDQMQVRLTILFVLTPPISKAFLTSTTSGRAKTPSSTLRTFSTSTLNPGKTGVYYTPEPVVRYIVRSSTRLEGILICLMVLPMTVTLLDPAPELHFSAEAIKLAVDEYTAKYGAGGKNLSVISCKLLCL